MRIEFIIPRGDLHLGDRVNVGIAWHRGVGNVSGFVGADRVMVIADLEEPLALATIAGETVELKVSSAVIVAEAPTPSGG